MPAFPALTPKPCAGEMRGAAADPS